MHTKHHEAAPPRKQQLQPHSSKPGIENNAVVDLTAASHPTEQKLCPDPNPQPDPHSFCWQARWMICCALPLLLPICLLWYAIAFLMAWLSTGLVIPSVRAG